MLDTTSGPAFACALAVAILGVARAQVLLDDRWSCQADQVIFGSTKGSHLGMAMAAGGDWNGDGHPDLVILGGVGTPPIGTAFVPSTADVFTAQGGTLVRWFTLTGLEAGYKTAAGATQSRSGAVTFLGDIDGGGSDDIAVSAPFWATEAATPNDRGQVYILLGELHHPPERILDVHAADIVIQGGPGDRLGWSIDGTGDLDDDGWNDLLIGAPGAIDDASFGARPGRVLIFRGKSLSAISKSVPGSGPVIIGAGMADHVVSGGPGGASGVGGDRFGYLVKVVGDMGLSPGARDCFVVGAIQAREATPPWGFQATGPGFAQLYGWPADQSRPVLLADIGPVGGPAPPGALFGISVARMSSLNGDGIPELLIGAPLLDGGGAAATGAVFAFDGQISSGPFSPVLEPLDGSGALAPVDLEAHAHFGWSLTEVGYFQGAGDAIIDIGIGAPGLGPPPPATGPCPSGAAYGGPEAGAIYVIDGSLALTAGSLSVLARYKGDDDISQIPSGRPRLGWSIAALDIDEDGSPDTIAGVMGASKSATVTETGKVAVFRHP